MTLEIGLRRFSFLPDSIQTGNGEPRKAHFLGKKAAARIEKQDQGGKQDQTPQEQETGPYRSLASISLGEVRDALDHFIPQLVPSPVEGWISRNYFCQLPVRQRTETQSPVVFGRVNTSFPSDGHIQNIKQMEMYFPGANPDLDLLSIRRGDLLLQEPVYSYCVGMKMFLSEAEMTDFSRSENIFIEKGFAPIYKSSIFDLIDLNEQHQASHLWLNVVGSEWYATLPDTVQPEIRERLRDLADWGKVVLNYHPRHYSMRYPSLNDALDFHYGFTKHYLIAPQDTGQTLQMVEKLFEQLFFHGIRNKK